MTSLFVQVLMMSVVASYVAAGVILIRLFIRKAPKIFSYALWSIVLFRLICPFSFESNISLIPKSVETTPQTISYLQKANINISAINGENIISGINQRQTAGPVDVFAVIWVAGILLILSCGAFSYLRFKQKISTATLVRDNIYETDLIHTPFVFGWIHPKIYVLTGMREDEFQYVLLHEQTHIRRRDYWIKPFAFLVLAVYWFNPVIWISYILMSRDMEMSCDESVIKSIKVESKNAYSNLLLSLSTKQSGLLNPLSFGRLNVKTRIQNILHYKKPAMWVTGAICVSVALAAILLISNPQSASHDNPYVLAFIHSPEYNNDPGPDAEETKAQYQQSTIESLTAYYAEDLKTAKVLSNYSSDKTLIRKATSILSHTDNLDVQRYIINLIQNNSDLSKADKEVLMDYLNRYVISSDDQDIKDAYQIIRKDYIPYR